MIRGLVIECTFKEFFRRDSRRILVVSVILNYSWERAQSTLYIARDGTSIPWWQCLAMSLGGRQLCGPDATAPAADLPDRRDVAQKTPLEHMTCCWSA
jgi:hypothetical protein